VAKLYNTGGASLFDFLAGCLIGDFNTANTKIPKKIMLLERTSLQQEDGSSSYDYKAISNFILLNSYPEKVEYASQSRVRFSFIIPRDLVENITSTNMGLGLYARNAASDEPENFVAFCALDLDSTTITNSSLVVDWELVIANKPTTEIIVNG
jgi:hypothetical protein